MKETCLISLKKGMTMVRLRILRTTSLLLAFGAAMVLGASSSASADGPEAAAKALPPDVQAIVSHVNDLDLLVALNPVKLTAEQIDKLLAVLEPISKSDDELTKQECDAIRGIAPDIEKARADSLKGAAPDADITARINKTLADFDAKNVAAHKEAVAKVVDAAKSTLTADQIKAVQHKYAQWNGGSITVPGELRNDSAKRAEYLFNLTMTEYVNRVFLVQRTIPLLKALKTPAVPGGTADQSGATDKTGTKPPAASPAK